MSSELEARIKACYSTWSESYYDEYYGPHAPYPPVHRELLKELLRDAGATSVLDAGCGPASFLRELADTDLRLAGFDVTPEMVTEAQRVLGDRGEVWTGSVLDPGAFTRGGPYDAALCIGVLPHVAQEADEVVVANLRDAVDVGGLVVAEARNQLFALFTLNRYTYEFFRDVLLRTDDETLAPLRERFRMDLPPVRRGREDEPGYDEVLSRTHNPFELRRAFEEAGLADVQTLFYHYHALPPLLEPNLAASLELEDPFDWRGHFMASAFLVVGRRT